MIYKYLLVLILICNTAFAADTPFLKKGDAAPFDGFLITEEQTDKIHDIKVDLEFTKRQNVLVVEENAILTERLNNTKQHVEFLTKQQVPDSMYTKVGFFVLGAVVTGVIAFGTAKAVR